MKSVEGTARQGAAAVVQAATSKGTAGETARRRQIGFVLVAEPRLHWAVGPGVWGTMR